MTQASNGLLGKPMADEIFASTRTHIEALAAKGWPVELVSISIGHVDAVTLYVRNQAKGAERAGIGL